MVNCAREGPNDDGGLVGVPSGQLARRFEVVLGSQRYLGRGGRLRAFYYLTLVEKRFCEYRLRMPAVLMFGSSDRGRWAV